MNTFAVACVQSESARTDSLEKNVEANLGNALQSIRRAAESGAGLIVFPELFTTGYFLDMLEEAGSDRIAQAADRTAAVLGEAAAAHRVAVATGMPEAVTLPDPHAYDSVRVFMPDGTAVEPYRKILPFPASREPGIFSPGTGLVAFEVGGFTVGILICYEVRFPELSRRYMDVPCDLLVIPAAFPSTRGHHWRTLVQARAVENQTYVAAANQAGTFGAMKFAGSSMITDPSGAVVASASEEGTALITAVVSKDAIRETRERIPCYADRDRLATRPPSQSWTERKQT